MTIMIFSAAPSSSALVRAIRRGSIWSATSLKALVGPCQSSRMDAGAPSEEMLEPSSATRGVTSSLANVSSYASATQAAISSAE